MLGVAEGVDPLLSKVSRGELRRPYHTIFPLEPGLGPPASKHSLARNRSSLPASGHTHWSDVFEHVEAGGPFERWHFDDLAAGRLVRGKLVLVNAPSATFAGFRSIRHARGPGFVIFDLDEDEAKVTYRFLH